MLNSHSLEYWYSVNSYTNKNVTIAKLYKLNQIDKGNVKECPKFLRILNKVSISNRVQH